MRDKVGDDFWLMWDCWMSLDLDYATRLAHRAYHECGLKWIEEALSPDDGVIEAIRHSGDRWIAAVQWHPEYGDDHGLFRGLVAAAEKR